MTFYTNIHPLLHIYGGDGNTNKSIEPGQVFTIHGISGDFYELKPINGDDYFFQVGVLMLAAAFTKSDCITPLHD